MPSTRCNSRHAERCTLAVDSDGDTGPADAGMSGCGHATVCPSQKLLPAEVPLSTVNATFAVIRTSVPAIGFTGKFGQMRPTGP